jgi:hypothetical protein
MTINKDEIITESEEVFNQEIRDIGIHINYREFHFGPIKVKIKRDSKYKPFLMFIEIEEQQIPLFTDLEQIKKIRNNINSAYRFISHIEHTIKFDYDDDFMAKLMNLYVLLTRKLK